MIEDILRIWKMIWQRKVKSQAQSVDFDQMLTFYKIREEKQSKILRKLYIQKLRRKWKILIYNSWFLDKNCIYDKLLKIKDQKNPEMNTSV